MREADNKGVSVVVNDNVNVVQDFISRLRGPVYFHPIKKLNNFNLILQNREKETEQRLIDSPLHISLRELRSIEN